MILGRAGNENNLDRLFLSLIAENKSTYLKLCYEQTKITSISADVLVGEVESTLMARANTY